MLVGGVMYQCWLSVGCTMGKRWIWEGFGPKIMFSIISHVLAISKFKYLGDVCLGYFKIIPKDIGECVVQCVI